MNCLKFKRLKKLQREHIKLGIEVVGSLGSGYGIGVQNIYLVHVKVNKSDPLFLKCILSIYFQNYNLKYI